MSVITIEGSLTPAGGLARGERRTVQDTPDVRAYVAKGFAVIVETDEPLLTFPEPDVPDPNDEPLPGDLVPDVPDSVNPPKLNASREDWAEFLAQHPDGYVTEGKDRAALIAEWEDNHPATDPAED